MLARVGGVARDQWRDWQYLAGLLATLLFLGAQPSRWRRTVRSVFVQQVMSAGMESVRFTVIVAMLVGISVVVQLVVWVGRVGQSQMLGPLLVSVVARELGPLFANFVLIVRGGSAIVTEMGLMKVGGEVRVLEAQGIEPLFFLVMPRVLGLAVAAFCLTVIFILGAFVSGYGFGAFIGQTNVDPLVFLNGMLKAVHPLDGMSIAVKCFLPALLTGIICATEGLSVGTAVTEVAPSLSPRRWFRC
jgi:phospholipid/cholesterol/gamma-HCH transport system permease protein